MARINLTNNKMEKKKSVNISDLNSLERYLSESDNSIDNVYISDIPDVCKEYPCLLGVDEAGRGPVLGPMVYGIAFCPLNEATLPDSLGCADSKVLTEENRDEIFSKMCKQPRLGWAVEVTAPNTICKNMLSRQKCSLNQVSMAAAVNLIRKAVNAGVKLAHVYVDTVGPPEKYQAYLKSIFREFDITVAKKADSTYPIVSAASICAKVTRDHALRVWHLEENLQLTREEFGSGYPGDPVTKKFLGDHCDPVFGYPQLVRFSWSTASDALGEAAYHVEWDNSDKIVSPTNLSITSFFKMTPKNASRNSEHEFFQQRNLRRKVEF